MAVETRDKKHIQVTEQQGVKIESPLYTDQTHLSIYLKKYGRMCKTSRTLIL